MTPTEEIEQRWEKATRGPWQWEEGGILRSLESKVVLAKAEPGSSADAVAIQHAPSDIRWLLDEVVRLRKDLQTAKERADAVCDLCGQPMPIGEKSFRYHGYSGPCPPNEDEVERLRQAEADRDRLLAVFDAAKNHATFDNFASKTFTALRQAIANYEQGDKT